MSQKANNNSSTKKPILGYWNLRGLAQPIRFMLAYLKIDYQEKLYEFGPEPDFDTNDFRKERFKLGLDFPNIPYWIDGPIKITQSKAILKYLARTYNPSLLASDPELETQYDMLENFVRDLWEAISENCYFYTEKGAKTFEIDQKLRLEQISTYLGTKKWLFGENISYVDFMLYEVLMRHIAYDSTWLQPNLLNYIKSFESIPAIAQNLKTSPFIYKSFIGPSRKKELCLKKDAA